MTSSSRALRNQSMELCKLIASFFVVFIHVPFPGALGGFVDCLGRFAVPTFFFISGYFNYGATGRQVLRRLKHIVFLFIIAALFRQLCECISIELQGGSTIAHLLTAIPDSIELLKLLILQIPPYTGNLWYLLAMVEIYLIFWVFVRFQEETNGSYRGFYMLCTALFTVFFAVDIIAPASGSPISAIPTRNGWFLGLPLFAAGLFLHQNQEILFRVFRPNAWVLTAVVAFGTLLSIVQWRFIGIGVVPFGTLFAVPALMLLMVAHPNVPFLTEKSARFLGALSTWVYLLHLTLSIMFNRHILGVLLSKFGDAGAYLEPWAVLAISLLAGAVCECFAGLLRKAAAQ